MADQLPEGQMLFSLLEVSQLLKISVSSLHRWRKDGDLSARKVGKQWRVPRSEVSRLYGTSQSHKIPGNNMVLPDDGDDERRRALGIKGGSMNLLFTEMQLLQMAIDHEDREQMRVMLDEFTHGDLEKYAAALIELHAFTNEVIEERQRQGAPNAL